MRRRLLDAPWWVLALTTGVPSGTLMAAFNIVVDDDPLRRGIFAAAVGAPSSGAFMGVFLTRVNRRTRAAVGDVAPDRRVAVVRSAAKGPVPEEPSERAAAARLHARLDELRA